MRQLSAIDAVSRAIDYMQFVLFRPFDLNKWAVIGLSAFLSTCGESGGGGNFGRLANGFGDFPGAGGGEFGDFDALRFVIIMAVAIFVVVMVFSVIAMWVNARGDFVFLDNLVRNETEVAKAWNEYAREGNQLFVFNIVFSTATLMLVGIMFVVAALIAMGDIQDERFGTYATIAVVFACLTVIPIVIGAWFVSWVMFNWGVPLMYRRRIGPVTAFGAAMRELVMARPLSVFFFWLVQLLAALVVGVLAMFLFCITCCLVAIPYVGSIITLPLIAFQRLLGVCFLEQLGPEYRILGGPSTEHIADTFR